MLDLENEKIQNFLKAASYAEMRRDIKEAREAASDVRASIVGDSYVNSYYGLSLNKPLGWLFPSVEMLFKAYAAIELPDSDEELAELVNEGLFLPLVCMSDRDPTSTDGLVQNIDINVENIDEAGDMWEVAQDSFSTIQEMVGELALEDGWRKVEVSGLPAVAFSWRYMMSSDEYLEPFEVRTRSWVVQREPNIFVIRANDSPMLGLNVDMDQFMTRLIIRPPDHACSNG
ncbi:MAG: hypothetical protein OEM03_11585 [Chromatiales bacterium]|nr:hypothetical protein [Chromatiales bacterium]